VGGAPPPPPTRPRARARPRAPPRVALVRAAPDRPLVRCLGAPTKTGPGLPIPRFIVTSHRFESITRIIAATGSRRSLLGALIGGLLALGDRQQGVDAPAQAATNKNKRRRRCPKGRRPCRRRCCRPGQVCRNGGCRNRPRPNPHPGGTPVRRDLHSLTAAQLQAFANGVAVMKQRSASDPRSWALQARMHADNCMHNRIHFLSWHRMYLYWFERILRDATGDDQFALPYWNYSTPAKRILPVPFRTRGNPLYDAERSDSVNGGQQPSETSIFDTSDAFAATNFTHTGNGTSFGGRGGQSPARGLIEQSPHNGVHLWIGGHMGAVATAALDPVFWLHHANIDRLWEAWLRRGNGRANPTGNTEFMETSFTFYDEGGNAVSMTGREILDTVEQLDYRYDDQPAGASSATASTASSPTAASSTKKSTVVGATTKSDRLKLGSRPVNVPLTIRDDVAATRPMPRTTLTLVGVAGGGVGGVTYEVHVGAKQGNPSWRDASFIGLIGLFGLQPWDHGGHAATMSYDITDALGAAGGGEKIEVTLIPVDLTGSRERPSGTWATIDRLVISVEGIVEREPNKPRANPKRKRPDTSKRTRPTGEQADKQPATNGATRNQRNTPRRSGTKKRTEEKQRRKGTARKQRTDNRRQRHDNQIRHSHSGTGNGANGRPRIPGNKSSAVAFESPADATGAGAAGRAHH